MVDDDFLLRVSAVAFAISVKGINPYLKRGVFYMFP